MQEWIAIYESVLGSKLRGFAKEIKVPEAEALGILCYLWFWARNNTDESGVLKNTDDKDISTAFIGHINEDVAPLSVVRALVNHGWLDLIDGVYSVHEWGKWQSHWYKYEKKKEADRKRKSEDRNTVIEKEVSSIPQEKEEKEKQETASLPKGVPVKPKPKKQEEQKVCFGEFVKLTLTEYKKLENQYGEAFTRKCIEKLDNYKGSKGATYKSDYRAILNWVAEKIKTENPELVVQQEIKNSGDNPFKNYI